MGLPSPSLPTCPPHFPCAPGNGVIKNCHKEWLLRYRVGPTSSRVFPCWVTGFEWLVGHKDGYRWSLALHVDWVAWGRGGNWRSRCQSVWPRKTYHEFVDEEKPHSGALQNYTALPTGCPPCFTQDFSLSAVWVFSILRGEGACDTAFLSCEGARLQRGDRNCICF